jgi:Domain of unknown function (DUF4062)
MQHRVFVSSTFSDLKDHRTTVQNAIRQLGVVDVSMEHFGARDARPCDECVRLIEQESDTFVGIYAHRYGHVPARSKRSITEVEYDAAQRAKLPRFTYVVDDEAPWNPKHIDSGNLLRRLQHFKQRLMAELIVKTFATRDDLATSVAADLGRHLATRQLARVEPAGPSRSRAALANADEWNRQRDGIYSSNRGLFLVHTLSPSRTTGQLFDIFIYLRQHKESATPEVEFAEFFLGRYWGNTVFRVPNKGGLVGLSTSAYGEFLCMCRVTLKDGTEFMLDRYIDFGSTAPPARQPNKRLQPMRPREESSSRPRG